MLKISWKLWWIKSSWIHISQLNLGNYELCSQIEVEPWSAIIKNYQFFFVSFDNWRNRKPAELYREMKTASMETGASINSKSFSLSWRNESTRLRLKSPDVYEKGQKWIWTKSSMSSAPVPFTILLFYSLSLFLLVYTSVLWIFIISNPDS